MQHIPKKRLIIGLTGLAVCAVIAVLFISLSAGRGPITELGAGAFAMFFIGVVAVTGAFGFLVYIFFGVYVGLVTFCPIAGYAILIFLVQRLADRVEGILNYLISGAAIVGVIFLAYNDRKRTKFAINGEQALSGRAKEKYEQQQEVFEELREADRLVKEEMDYLNKSFLVTSTFTERIWQIVKNDDGYLFHPVGGVFTDIKPEKLITDFETRRKLEKGDFVLTDREISSIRATLKSRPERQVFGAVTFALKNGKSKKYKLFIETGQEEIKQFFGEYTAVTDKRSANEGENVDVSAKTVILNRLNNAKMAYSIAMSVLFGLYLSVGMAVRWLFATIVTLYLIGCLLPLIAYVIFRDHLTAKDRGKFEGPLTDGKISILGPLLIPVWAMTVIDILMLQSFDIYDYKLLLLLSLIPAAALTAAFFGLTREYNRRPSVIFCVVLFIVAFSFIGIFNMDIAYDNATRRYEVCEVVEMPVHTDNNGNVTYYVVFDYDGAKIKKEVEKDVYDGLSLGSDVNVVILHGAFGIEKGVMG